MTHEEKVAYLHALDRMEFLAKVDFRNKEKLTAAQLKIAVEEVLGNHLGQFLADAYCTRYRSLENVEELEC